MPINCATICRISNWCAFSTTRCCWSFTFRKSWCYTCLVPGQCLWRGSLCPYFMRCTSAPARLGRPCSRASPNVKILTLVSSSACTCLPQVGHNTLIFSPVPNLKPQTGLIPTQRGRQCAVARAVVVFWTLVSREGDSAPGRNLLLCSIGCNTLSEVENLYFAKSNGPA